MQFAAKAGRLSSDVIILATLNGDGCILRNRCEIIKMVRAVS